MKKIFKVTAATLFILSLLAIPLTGCSESETAEEEAETSSQVYTVQTGDLSTEITAAGNLALSETEDVVVDIFYDEATIAEVLVETGDTVTAGQVLVRLDADEWADELVTLEDAVTTKERALTSAQLSLISAQETLEETETGDTLTKAVLTAETALVNAQDSLDTARASYDWDGFDAVTANLTKAKAYYSYILRRFNEATDDVADLELLLEQAKDNLDAAQADYDNFVGGYATPEIANAIRSLEIAEMNLVAAQKNLENLPQEIAKQELNVELAEGNVADAEKALADAQEKLASAREKSSEMTAPFDGFVTTVKVEGGDEVYNGTVVVTVADPNKFEAEIYIGETDILNISLGDEAIVSLDAIPDVNFPAEVTHISPTATVASSVVSYAVTVAITSLTPVSATTAWAMPEIPADFTPPTDLPEDFTPPADSAPPAIAETATAEEEYTLKDGMTAVVTLTLIQTAGVLVVPYEAVTIEDGQSYVEVLLSTGETEKRAIVTGDTDYTYYEVVSGLSEGEQIMVYGSTFTIVATSTNDQEEGIMIPGMMGGSGPPAGGGGPPGG